ncbi:MAG: hypothetical protein Kow0031_26160 [Anaerolineae bacterium]
MAHENNIDHVENLIDTKAQRLQIQREKEAFFGPNTPPEILMEIRNLEGELQKLQALRADLRRQREARLSSRERQPDEAEKPAASPAKPPRPALPTPAKWAIAAAAAVAVVLLVMLFPTPPAETDATPHATALPSPAEAAGQLVTDTPAVTPTLTGEPMPKNGFNIAVAEFTSVTGDPLLNPDDGTDLQETLVAAMKATQARLPSFQQLGEVRPVPAIPGTDPQSREDNAALVAETLRATVVVYGRIAPAQGGGYQVYPALYVPPSTQGFDYGAEIVGATQFGEPVQFWPPLAAPEMADVNAHLQARIEALQHVVLGLSHFGIRQDELAYAEYNLALNRLRESAPDESGQEVLHLLLGAVKLREFQRFGGVSLEPDVTLNPTLAEQARQQADSHFSDGLLANPHYDRLNLGLGAVALAQAIQQMPASGPWPDTIYTRLVDALDFYSAALAAPDEQSPSGYVPVKAHFGVAQAHLGLYSYYMKQVDGLPDSRELALKSHKAAETNLQQVLSAYREVKQPAQLLELAGQAQSLLARLALSEAAYFEDAGQPDAAQPLWRQTLLACEEALPLLTAAEQDDSRLAVYYHAQCLDWQAVAYSRIQPPDPAAAANACATAVPLGINSGALQPHQFSCRQADAAAGGSE